jgi:hypothetical protein
MKNSNLKISRYGACHYHGNSSIDIKSFQISLGLNHSFNITARNIKDFNTNSHHNYEINLSSEVFTSLIMVMAEAAESDPIYYEKLFEPVLKSINRLQAVASGIPIQSRSIQNIIENCDNEQSDVINRKNSTFKFQKLNILKN